MDCWTGASGTKYSFILLQEFGDYQTSLLVLIIFIDAVGLLDKSFKGKTCMEVTGGVVFLKRCSVNRDEGLLDQSFGSINQILLKVKALHKARPFIVTIKKCFISYIHTEYVIKRR